MNQVPYHCPLCNGYNTFHSNCPQCQSKMVDYGPVSYLLAAYSPYRPIEEMKQNDGIIDMRTHQCPHETFCPHCGYEEVVMIKETQNKNPYKGD